MDVFNALNQMENESFLKELKFGSGDGSLHYYLFNWKCATFHPKNVRYYSGHYFRFTKKSY